MTQAWGLFVSIEVVGTPCSPQGHVRIPLKAS